MLQLESIEDEMGIPARRVSAPGRLRRLLQKLHRQTGQPVAILVDEYDKPILDALEMPEVACANRDYLRGLYGMIKSSDAHVRFTFVTGVSKFTKVSIFSDLNNLTDITLDRRYSAICGYTEADLDAVFAPELGGLDREQVREWYNGYRWRGPEKVYNPYDVLLLLDSREFKAHWFETGTPAFLLDTLFERRLSSVSLSGMLGTEDLLSAFDVNKIGTEALLFQTGYLTITEEQELGGKALYRLGYPNREVRQSLNEQLLRHLVQDAAQQTANSIRLARLLEAHDCAGLKDTVPRLLRQHSVPMVHQQPHRRLRRLLRQRVLLLLRRPRLRRRGAGVEQPRTPGHGGAHRRPRVPVRVQGGRDGAARFGPRPVAGAPLRRQVPRHRRADPPDRRRVQPRHPQRHRLRSSRRLTAATGRPDESGFRAPRGAAQRRGLRGCLRGLDDYGKLRHLLTVNRQLNGNFDLLRHLIGTGWVDSEITSGFPLEHLNQRENFLSLLQSPRRAEESAAHVPPARRLPRRRVVRRGSVRLQPPGARDGLLGAWRPLLEFLEAPDERDVLLFFADLESDALVSIYDEADGDEHNVSGHWVFTQRSRATPRCQPPS